MATVQARIEKHSIPEPNTGCWIWLGGVASSVRGSQHDRASIKYQGRRCIAARVVYRECIADIPDGLQVLHRCDNPLCVNPDHLWLGTHADNMADKATKGRANIWNGERRGAANPKAKLTEGDVRVIRSLDEPQLTIAARFGIARETVSQIRNRRTWAHVA